MYTTGIVDLAHNTQQHANLKLYRDKQMMRNHHRAKRKIKKKTNVAGKIYTTPSYTIPSYNDYIRLILPDPTASSG
jgi:hypothetical protein